MTKIFLNKGFVLITAALFLVGGFFVATGTILATNMNSQVDYYTVSGDSGFIRSLTPLDLSSGGGTVSQSTDGSSVTVNINGTTTYADSGFYTKPMKLGDVKSITITGSSPYGINIWFDKSGDGDFFTWDVNNKMTALGGDSYILGPSSQVDGTLVVDDSSNFTSMIPGGGNYTLAQLKNGNASGITSDTKIAFWVGTTAGSGGTQSATISTFDVVNPPVVNTNTGNRYSTIQAAVAAAHSSDTITVAAGTYDLTAQLNITMPLSIVGSGSVTLQADPSFVGACSSSSCNPTKHLIDVSAGTAGSPVTLSNVTLDSNSQSYGAQAYGNAYLVLDNVTLENSKGAGLTVNGSTVVATNLNTSGNAWGAVNVDPGSGVTTPSVFTLNSGTLAESTQIWSDGRNVSDSATVFVTASGYNKYLVGGTTKNFFWTNQSGKGATITNGDITTYYSTIQAAVTAATPGGTINVGAGTYTEQITISKALTINGSDGAVLSGTGLVPTWTTGVKIKSSNVTFNNIDVTNFTQDGIIVGYEASIPGNLQNVHITNCKISNIQPGNWGFGIICWI